MTFHSLEVRRTALTLLREGIPNAEVARRLDVPYGTISYWKHKDRATRGECPGRKRSTICFACDRTAPLDERAYSHLLGLYLGDGHISFPRQHPTPSLTVTLDDTWPGIQDECEQVIRLVFPDRATCRVRSKGCHHIKVYSSHLFHLFPQHGPGKKHHREIALESWQQEIVDAHPWDFLRGLIQSDGCRITNWTTRIVAGARKRYEYPRYWFTNVSDDIRKVYTDTLDLLGIEWTECYRHGNPYNISVARKASVARMDAHIGPKY
ncbi:helix-turn-helix domain-containing protein [Streptomyces sp. NPDC004959]|uniref:helix-turn-helix domain-containing protein n=1 Tax=unclassified Streptomyces TaxID=2593676 RepID=UPI0004CB2539|nr:helix-turn-helix domain-containing protein [Streptomyces sp. NRRL F-5630]